MSTTTIQRVFRVNGTPTDVTAIVLTTPVTRTDTGAIVLPQSTAWTRVGTGTYQLPTFTDPAGGLTYAYTVQYTYTGETFSFPATSPGGVLLAGLYSDLSAWDDFAGTLNVQIYSDKDNIGAQNASAIQRAMNYADDQINSFYSGSYQIPLVFNAGQVTETVRTWATVIGMGKWLYFGRGLYDGKGNDGGTGNRFRQLVKDTYDEMDEYRGGWQRLPVAPLIGTGLGTGIVAVPPSVNADGTRYIPRPAGSWGGYFNGQYWSW